MSSEITAAVTMSRRNVTNPFGLLLLLILKEVGNARQAVNELHTISPKTQAPQYQPIEIKKKKVKQLYTKVDRAA